MKRLIPATVISLLAGYAFRRRFPGQNLLFNLTIASLIVPGRTPGGFIGALIVGLLGGLIGGWLFSTFLGGNVSGFIGSLIVATIGAVIILFILRAFSRDRSRV